MKGAQMLRSFYAYQAYQYLFQYQNDVNVGVLAEFGSS